MDGKNQRRRGGPQTRRIQKQVSVLRRGLPVLALALFGFNTVPRATAQVVEEYTYTVNAQIPDYPDEFGYEDIRTVSGSAISIIGDVNVYLTITGGYLGDLFVSLSHGSGYAVLLNRPGRRSGDALGYGDSGLDNALFDDAASDGDVHVYRLTLSGEHTTPLGGPLGGSWAPDARTTNPTSVLDTDARSALLSSFNDLGTDGEWSLRLFDYNAGGTATLVSWTLVVTAPEPSSYAAIFAGVCALGAGLRRWRDRNQRALAAAAPNGSKIGGRGYR